MPITVGSSVTVPAPSSFTLTPTIAESVPQPIGAHPEVRSVPITSESKIVNGMLCSSKNKETSALLAPNLSRSWASCLMDWTRRVNIALRCLQSMCLRYCFSASQLTPTMTTIAAAILKCRLTAFTTPVSCRADTGASKYRQKSFALTNSVAFSGHFPISQI
jgi:hypothetical protein